MQLYGSSLVVAADGREARVFIERRRGGPLDEITSRLGDLTSPPLLRRAQGGQAMHLATPLERQEMDFLTRLGERLDCLARSEHTNEVVLFAPPRALGLLKAAAPATLKRRLAASEPHERTQESPSQIREALVRLRVRSD